MSGINAVDSKICKIWDFPTLFWAKYRPVPNVKMSKTFSKCRLPVLHFGGKKNQQYPIKIANALGLAPRYAI